MVFGKTDAHHQFHPIALNLTSHETQYDFERFYAGLNQLKSSLNPNICINYIMQDACGASLNAALSVFGAECVITMCFFHVMLNVRKHLHYLDKKDQDAMKRSIHDLHMTRSVDEYESKLVDFKQNWNHGSTKRFYEYFFNSWIQGNHTKWQVFQNPIGFANTNSPIESFNNTIKTAFTFRKKRSVFHFIKKMMDIVSFYSLNKATFHTEFPIQKDHLKKSKQMQKGDFEQLCSVRFKYKNTYVVNIEKKTCKCRNFFKWGCCPHLVGAKKFAKPDQFVTKAKKGRIPLAKKALLRD